MDVCSRRIVVCALAEDMRSDLVVDARGKPTPSGAYLKYDPSQQPRQRAESRTFRDMLWLAGMSQGLSARANLCRNAWSDSFLGAIKVEMLANDRFIKAADARVKIFPLNESICNMPRHQTLSTAENFSLQDRCCAYTKPFMVLICVTSHNPRDVESKTKAADIFWHPHFHSVMAHTGIGLSENSSLCVYAG